jgi:hypothetical protein
VLIWQEDGVLMGDDVDLAGDVWAVLRVLNTSIAPELGKSCFPVLYIEKWYMMGADSI